MLLVDVILIVIGSCLFIYIGASGPKKLGLWWMMVFGVLALVAVFGPSAGLLSQSKSGLIKIKDLPSIVLQLQGQAPTIKNGNIATLENTADGKLYFVPTDQLSIEPGSFVRSEGSGKNWRLVLADHKEEAILKLNTPSSNDPNNE